VLLSCETPEDARQSPNVTYQLVVSLAVLRDYALPSRNFGGTLFPPRGGSGHVPTLAAAVVHWRRRPCQGKTMYPELDHGAVEQASRTRYKEE
jgi:hypothetical protein